ncbi:unnamed protein product [Miscanthus lutarioriparius]|uniref:CCHC-type domain-containing protein n=1 Tax=Miscanthus lutarioriparius TaxID=422564 RepID=A0A811MFT4_9POAL|nr:unnamed protein product [Miscanthus lutarioriparius]
MAPSNQPFTLRSILEKDKLNGTNYADWIHNLRIVLRAEKKEEILDTPLPQEPVDNAPAVEKNAYKRACDGNLEVSCLMLACMEPDLQLQFDNNHAAHDMIVALNDMFQTQARTERFSVSKAFAKTKLAEGVAVGPHVIKMVGYTQRLEKLGFPIGHELATDFILASLPPSYGNFVANYHMHGAEKGLNELCGMLKTTEADIKKGAGSSHVMAVQNKPKFKKKGNSWKKKRGKAKDEISKPNPPAPKAGPAADAECFHCHGKGHWKRNCKLYLESIKDRGSKGHISENRMKRLHSDGLLTSFDFESYETCEACLLGKITKMPFIGFPERASMMSQSDLPLSFWGYALETTTFTLNRVLSKSVVKTPHEMWTDKLTPKSDKCFFVGYPKETLGYYFYNRSEGKVFVARNGVFIEKEFLKIEKSGHKVYLEEVQDEPVRKDSTSDANVAEQVEIPVAIETPPQPRRSARIHELRGDLLLLDDDEPATYAEAMMDPDSEKWQTEAEYIAASGAAKEGVWMRRFLIELGVFPNASSPLNLHCDNNGAIAQAKEPRNHQKNKHVLRKFHLIREFIRRDEIKMCKIHIDLNVADPLTKALPQPKHEAHMRAMGIRYL